MPRLTPDQLLQELTGAEDLLIVQDLDGVCMQLVKDPLTRRTFVAQLISAKPVRSPVARASQKHG